MVGPQLVRDICSVGSMDAHAFIILRWMVGLTHMFSV